MWAIPFNVYTSPLTKFSEEVSINMDFLKVVGLNTRFSDGKKQKSKNFLRLLDSWGEFSEDFAVKRAFFWGLWTFQSPSSTGAGWGGGGGVYNKWNDSVICRSNLHKLPGYFRFSLHVCCFCCLFSITSLSNIQQLENRIISLGCVPCLLLFERNKKQGSSK